MSVTFVIPAPGVTVYHPGASMAYAPGQPVPLPTAHADELVASGHATLHDPAAPVIAEITVPG